MSTPPPSAPPARNLELKVRCREPDLDGVRRRAEAAGIGAFRRLRQVDTYFAVAKGRLKLRQIVAADDASAAELIAYARPDEAGPRWSAYHRVPVAAAEAAPLKAALASTAGILAVVDKTREVAIHRRTRIHLDRVRGLGAFVELETVVAAGDDGAAAELAETAALLGLDRYEVIAGSYGDLIRPAGSGSPVERSEGENG